MMTRLVLAVGLACVIAAAQQGTEPRRNPQDYPVCAEAGGALLGVEYLVRSAGTGNEMFIIPEHLVIEVAVYPAKGQPVDISAGHFTLRVNGKKTVLFAQTPGMVAAGLKYPDWGMRPTLVGTAGIGDGTVVIGRPRRVERFPGDTRPAQTSPRMSTTTADPNELRPEEVVVEAALPEGATAGPVSGYLYFFYKGKPKKIKSLELLYDTGERKTNIKLF